jgi:hypothetical protein
MALQRVLDDPKEAHVRADDMGYDFSGRPLSVGWCLLGLAGAYSQQDCLQVAVGRVVLGQDALRCGDRRPRLAALASQPYRQLTQLLVGPKEGKSHALRVVGAPGPWSREVGIGCVLRDLGQLFDGTCQCCMVHSTPPRWIQSEDIQFDSAYSLRKYMASSLRHCSMCDRMSVLSTY